MTIKKTFGYLLIIALFVAIFPLISFGQTSNDGFLNLSVSPANPEPLQTVTVSLESFSYDLDRSFITWLVNGVEKKSGTGLKKISIQADTGGQETVVTTIVQTPADGVKQATITFTPATVDLIFEAISYTPPFYKGKALNPNQGKVLVVAIPELIKDTGEKISSKNIIFSWKKDGQVMQSSSGLGKNVFAFAGTVPIRDAIIQVTVSSLDGSLSATKQITVTTDSPQIIFYENSPLYGLMTNKAIVNPVKLLEDEFSVVAIPYFFSVLTPTSSNLDFVWSLNGQTVNNQDPENSFTTRVEKAGAGVAEIGLKISNSDRIFQFTDNRYTINFEKQ